MLNTFLGNREHASKGAGLCLKETKWTRSHLVTSIYSVNLSPGFYLWNCSLNILPSTGRNTDQNQEAVQFIEQEFSEEEGFVCFIHQPKTSAYDSGCT